MSGQRDAFLNLESCHTWRGVTLQGVCESNSPVSLQHNIELTFFLKRENSILCPFCRSYCTLLNSFCRLHDREFYLVLGWLPFYMVIYLCNEMLGHTYCHFYWAVDVTTLLLYQLKNFSRNLWFVLYMFMRVSYKTWWW